MPVIPQKTTKCTKLANMVVKLQKIRYTFTAICSYMIQKQDGAGLAGASRRRLSGREHPAEIGR